jgi:CDGSH-type Zn-finger protein
MDKEFAPIIAAKKPIKVELEGGKNYFLCWCGRSTAQPFCDGSHRGTSMSPVKFTVEKTDSVALCQCNASANAPFCDGNHARPGRRFDAYPKRQ